MMIHPLLPELIRLQRRDRYLAPEALAELSERLSIPVNTILSVAELQKPHSAEPRQVPDRSRVCGPCGRESRSRQLREQLRCQQLLRADLAAWDFR